MPRCPPAPIAICLALSALARAAPAQPATADRAPAAEVSTAPSMPPPATAVGALDRANAAYEYGDMTQVVDATRPIVDGALPATESERAQALRLLGIGLYLTSRQDGAESTFVQLLHLRPKSRLDPATTRPEVVAFFEDIRRRHAAEIEDAARARTRKSLAWAFLPPLGQFKNHDSVRGFLILGLEVVSLAGAITTKAVLSSWREPGATFGDRTESARTLKTLNYVAVGLFAATYVAGVVDALLRTDREPDERAHVTFVIVPTAVGVQASF